MSTKKPRPASITVKTSDGGMMKIEADPRDGTLSPGALERMDALCTRVRRMMADHFSERTVGAPNEARPTPDTGRD
jgi:hypothetical protein